MAGHEIVQNGEDPVVTMNSLINDHDVIFALTDSREARWLATVIAKARDKPIINVALGFDSYLVMRHGQESLSKEEKLTDNLVVSYFSSSDSPKSQKLFAKRLFEMAYFRCKCAGKTRFRKAIRTQE